MKDVLIKKLITEKSAKLEPTKVYTFEVALKSTKHSVANAIKTIYGMTPVKVTLLNRSGKVKRVGKYRKEQQKQTKKIAYVTLATELGQVSDSK